MKPGTSRIASKLRASLRGAQSLLGQLNLDGSDEQVKEQVRLLLRVAAELASRLGEVRT